MIDFAKCFKELTDYPPFAWQIKLYKKFLADEIPSSCDIPTGLGKTSVIVIWLLALANKLLENSQENTIPRRLVYVVDRRVIVDQATDEAERILCRLKDFENSETEDLRNVFTALQNASFFAERKKDDKETDVVALSTLRGEYADNREWCLDPSRPAIIVGTIDMIGSRLLFSAYGGVGESYKALQAGLLGQDSLIVIDEAHLSPAFVKMLEALPDFVDRKKAIKHLKVMFLSATLDNENTEEKNSNKVFSLENDAPEDLTNEISAARLNAEKQIKWETFTVSEEEAKQAKKEKKSPYYFQAKKMTDAALQYKDLPVSVLIFGRQVELVKEIKRQLLEQINKERVLLMVGGMRGFERDNLVNHHVFQKFGPNRNRNHDENDKAYFLVATSCAEVGVNLDADFAVCDLSSADSFIQRLGRINRFGNNSSVVTIVYNENLSEENEQAIETLKTLKAAEMGAALNATPLELRKIDFPKNCYPPKPVCPPLDSARIDDWAMTSLKQDQFRRPLVSYWLRGVTENNSAETSFCWRTDLQIISKSEKLTGKAQKDEAINKRIAKKMIASVKAVRVKSRECAREATYRTEKVVLRLAEDFPDYRIVLISPANEYEVIFLREFKENIDLYKKLMFSTLVLPCEVGGLSEGIVTDEKTGIVPDVLEESQKGKENTDAEKKSSHLEWRRIILTENDGIVTAKPLISENPPNEDFNPFADEKYDSFKDAVKKISTAENRKEAGIIDLGDFTETDEEESVKKRKIAYLIAKKSPESYLPNEAQSDGEGESEISSIGFPKTETSLRKGETSVDDHNKDVAKIAKDMAEKLHLDYALVEALKLAGENHDKGKARECWQKAVGNYAFPETIPLAKSNQNWFGHKYNNYYRHEFGSLIEAEENEEIKNHPRRDLILHLIAAHHGYARPHFPERAFDRENPKGANFEIAERAMLRFANLQIEYGWWQLAYLEAILKAADALASRAEARGEKI